jgi:hypothetical protein
MTLKDQILQELEQVPETVLQAVLDFLQFVKQREAQNSSAEGFGQFAGILSDTEAAAIQRIVAEEFEQIVNPTQSQEIRATGLLHESTLSKDWLLPEEDEAWQNL